MTLALSSCLEAYHQSIFSRWKKKVINIITPHRALVPDSAPDEASGGFIEE